MIKYCVTLLLLTTGTSIGQRLVPQFGVLTDAEKTMTAHPVETDASAVVLFDIGDSYFFDTDDGYDIRFTRMKRMKIFTRAGIEQATVTIPYYVESPARKEKVVSIEAFTYTLRDGLAYKKPLDPTTIFDEQINTRWRVKKFAFPDVQEGSIVEYKYILETPFHFNLPDWQFQSRIPTLYSEYTVSMIPFYEYVFIAQGLTKFDYQASEVSKKQRTWGHVSDALGGATQQSGFRFNDMVHTYAMKNIPSFSDESFITSVDDYIMKMDFQLSKFNRPTGGSQNVITTWPALNKALIENESFGKYLSAATRLSKKIVEKELALAPDLSEDKKCEAIVNYVRSNFRWNDELSYFSSKSAKEFQEQRNGNIAEINLFLTALLRSAGLNAEPVILSSRSHGKIRADYPYSHYFDAVLVLVSGQKTFLTDASENLLAYNRIPVRFINEKGLIVSEGDPRWASLEPRIPSLEEINLQVKLEPHNNKSIVSGKITATEYEAYEYRRRLQNDSSNFRKYLVETHQLNPLATQLLSFENAKLPCVMMFTAEAPLEQAGNRVIIQPLLNFPLLKNPFQQETRNYPVDFIYPRASRIKSDILVPTGYKVGALPENIMIENDLAQVRLSTTVTDGNVSVQADLVIKKSTYSPSEYSRLRNLFALMVKGFNSEMVLEEN